MVAALSKIVVVYQQVYFRLASLISVHLQPSVLKSLFITQVQVHCALTKMPV
ncbi:MAG: hypothetical protein RMY28_028035 [Nostoc sp. ChiSLP01]|nr:hypothetical protein [Nostoc sp. ChiSLP01]